jgi:LCP family protein required for cell wall assembly
LLLGSDWRENSGTSDLWENSYDNQRADVIILARIDAAKKQVTLVSVPRDTRWNYEGKTYKINEAYNIGGAALETQAISELTGVKIAHTVETHFSGLENLVDALGGVWIDVPQTIEYKDALTGEQVVVEEGRQLLTGQQAQIFARVRKAYSGQNASGQDATRQGNVRTLVLAIADTIREKPFFEYPGLGLAIADCLGSDMNLGDFVQLALGFGGGGLTLYSGTGPAAGEIDEANDGLWLCYENPEGWKAVMDVVDAGGDPSDIDADSYLVTTPAVEEGYYDEYGNYIDPNNGYADYGYYEEGDYYTE